MNKAKLPSREAADDLEKRLQLLRKLLSEKRLDGFLVSSQVNRYYLTGWWGDSESGYLFITPSQAFIITDSRYTEEVSKQVNNFEMAEIDPYRDFWGDFLGRTKSKKIGFESWDLTIAALKKIKKQRRGVSWVETENLIESLREFKDQGEVKKIRKAIAIAEESFSFIKRQIKVGMREKEIAKLLENFMKEKGASKNAWENLIVATGSSSSMVHYAAGERKVGKGDQILLDWGCVYQGYHCDISRVVFLGEPTKKQVETYNLVLEAQKRAMEKIKIGVRTSELDLTARGFLKSKTQFYFRHALGHGVGLEIHELPRLNEKAVTKIEPGQIFTVEPGIYQPEWGGVRLEDMVLVTKTGFEVLTKSSKKLKDSVIG